jgi:hypothetical protein
MKKLKDDTFVHIILYTLIYAATSTTLMHERKEESWYLHHKP